MIRKINWLINARDTPLEKEATRPGLDNILLPSSCQEYLVAEYHEGQTLLRKDVRQESARNLIHYIIAWSM